MIESLDSLDFCMEEIPVTERNAVPISCWQDVPLSNIWIPSHLLPNRSLPSSTQTAKGIFHTLERKDLSKYIESFSVYLDSNSDEEIFFSDSDEDIFDLPKFEETAILTDNALPTTSNTLSSFQNICNNGDASVNNESVNPNFKRTNDKIYPRDNLTFVNLTNSSLVTSTSLNEEKSIKVLNSAGNLNPNFKSKNDKIIYPTDNVTLVNLTNSSLDTSNNLNEEMSMEILNSARNFNLNFKEQIDKNRYPREDVTFVNIANSSLDTSTNQNEEKNMKILNSAGNLMNNQRFKDTADQNILNKDVTRSLSSLAIVNDFHGVKTKNFDEEDRQAMLRQDQNADSLISLNEILNIPPDIDMNDFTFKKKDDFAICSTDYEPNSKKNKKEKKVKKKATKQIPLDMLFEDPDATQQFYCDKYFKKILQEREKNTQINKESLRNEEYAGFESEENIGFYETTNSENAAFRANYFSKPEEISRTSINENIRVSTRYFNESEEFNEIQSTAAEGTSPITEGASLITERASPITEGASSIREGTPPITEGAPPITEKIVIENIPCGVSEEDISIILEGLGKIKSFFMIPTGRSLSAFIEIDLNCDIDWVIECLDGSEPFGASDVIRCYKQE